MHTCKHSKWISSTIVTMPIKTITTDWVCTIMYVYMYEFYCTCICGYAIPTYVRDIVNITPDFFQWWNIHHFGVAIPLSAQTRQCILKPRGGGFTAKTHMHTYIITYMCMHIHVHVHALSTNDPAVYLQRPIKAHCYNYCKHTCTHTHTLHWSIQLAQL